eukprot:4545326-Alexandrium_andersonii.AAC.1
MARPSASICPPSESTGRTGARTQRRCWMDSVGEARVYGHRPVKNATFHRGLETLQRLKYLCLRAP